MALPHELRTERLLLRRWRLEDRDAVAAINADARVMEHFPGLMSREQSDASAERIATHFANHGYAQWAVEIPTVTPFAGFVGLSIPGFKASFTPCVEIGWRLAAEFWGHGYATEGAEAALHAAFESVGLDEIVAYAVVGNVRSRRVMEKLGMRDAKLVFDHPKVREGSPLRAHCLYRISRDEWAARRR